jgi:PAS domain S-box-containing protein
VSAASLDRYENLFRLLVESAKDYAIFVLDPNGVVATWNEGAQRIKGYRADEIIGKHFSIFYPPEDIVAGKCEMELRVAAAEGRFEDEGIRLRKDGSTFWANVIITALRNESGELIGFAKVTRDLTERRRREEARVQQAMTAVLQLQAIQVTLANARTPAEVINLVVQEGGKALGSQASSFLRKIGDEIETIALTGMDEEWSQKLARFPASWVLPSTVPFTTKQPVWLERREDFANYPDSPSLDSHGACALPLVVDDRVLGVIGFRFREPRAFSASERAFLETFVGQAAQALARVETQLREAETRRRLDGLGGLALALSRAITTHDVGTVIVERGRDESAADTCTLHIYDETAQSLVLLDERGCNPEVVPRIRVLPREAANPSWRAIETGEALWVQTEKEYATLFPALSQVHSDAPRVRSFWAVPLVTEGKPIGLLGMGFLAERTFPPAERVFIETFARQCSDALVRASRLAEEQRARAWLATTLRSIGDAVIATDAHGNVTMMNPIAEALTGWLETEARGVALQHVFNIVNENTRAAVESPVTKVLEVGTVVGLANHTLLIAKDGRETPIDDSGAPIRGVSGRIEGVVLVFRDVTDKKREEHRRGILEQASAMLAESLDYEATLAKVARLAVPGFADWCGVDLVGEDGVTRQVAVAHVDPKKIEWARELGRKYPPLPDAPYGVPNVLRTGKPELYPEVTEEMIRADARDEEHLRITLGLHLRSVILVPLLAHGRILGVMSFLWAESENRYSERDLAFAEDLARRCASAIDNARIYDAEQQARAAADVANRAKDEFLAMVSHELRTPLNAIMGWAKMLASGTLDAAKSERAIATIDRNAVAMAQLIEDLLDISRIISGKMRLEVQTVHLGRVLEAAVDAVRPAADAKGITIQERADGETMMGDPARLQQVIWNLLSNAVKFTPKGGLIVVDLLHSAQGLEITVKDNGKGIDPRFLPHVFDAFRQQDASHTRSRGGLGLGLAITRQLVVLHGGVVTAESEGEGKGARFRVVLPAVSSPVSPRAQTGRIRKFRLDSVFEQLPQLSGVHALVVDDEEDARMLLKTVLEEVGAKVTLAGNMEDALAAIAYQVPDVLVSDIGMPVHDGYDLIRAIRALPVTEGGSIPAAALTAYARAEDRRRAIDAGFSMHMPKPIDPAELVAVVATLTKASRTG